MEDFKFDIALGASARTKNWKNNKKTWSWFVKMLSNPVVTSETLKRVR